MNRSNWPVTSREYKLMLNADRFKDREQGSEAFWSLVDFLVDKQGGKPEKYKKVKKKKRRTWYADTAGLALRRHGFVLRLREEEGEVKKYKITLKCRASDRYVSASQDVSSSEEGKTKFEEDIMPPFTSKFAHSTAVRTNELPSLGEMDKAVALFPGLKALEIPGNTPIETVNSFTAYEIALWIGKIYFGEGPKIKACLTFWYLLGEEDELPLVAEFSFDYDVLKRPPEDHLEQFPTQVVAGTNRFFKTLQKQSGWINFNATTKTAYAYDAL